MDGNNYLSDRSGIALEILYYLMDHPQAKDTLDGITQWWILERRVIYQRSAVKEALESLISNSFVIKERIDGTDYCYRMNAQKREEIKAILK